MTRLPALLAGLCACTAMTPLLAQSAPAAPAAPAPAAASASGEEDGDPIVVRGARLPGSVIGDIAPEVTLSSADIRTFGVSSISDLLDELAPQTNSGQGRGGESPVVLLNGKRISSFAEIRDIPTEAIQRVEVLPEEVGLKYGYTANQKVVNIVLRRRFRAYTGEAEVTAPTAGGQFSPELDGSYFRIMGVGRLNVAVKAQHSSALTESERDILSEAPRQPYAIAGNITSAIPGAEINPALTALLGRPATVVGVPLSAAAGAPTLADFADGGTINTSDLGRYRTLLPQTDTASLNAVYARPIFGNVSATFNGTLTYSDSDAAQGLPTTRLDLPAGNPYSPFGGDTYLYRYLNDFGALAQDTHSFSGHFGTTLNGTFGKWNWTFTGNYDHADSRTATDRGFDLTDFQARLDALDPTANPYGELGRSDVGARLTDHARSISNTGNGEFVFTGSLFAMPAGDTTTTIKLGGTISALDSRSVRSGLLASADLSRDIGSGQISFDLPIASRKKGVLSPLGELSANFNAAYNRISDFGGQRTIGAGLTWKPAKPWSIVASISKDEGAPTVQQLGNPLVTTTGVRVFDYIRGETVDIARLAGGNPDLRSDDRRVLKLGLTWKPIASSDLTVTANYTDSRVRHPIASFPTATAAIEEAFPDRFTRDASGQLLSIDSRPINFDRQDQEQLRWGINFSKQLSAPPRPAGGRGGDGQPPNLRELLPSGQQADRPGDDRRNGGDRGGPGGGFGGGPGGGGFGRGNFGRGTRLQLAVYHTIHLRDDILIYQGGPKLDLLNGDAIGSAGGQARHEVQVQAGILRNGMGARLSGSWQSSTRVDGFTSAQSLRFSDLTTLNLRLFADLGLQRALVSKWRFLRGSRVTFSVTNLFDAHQHVRDINGDTPISYQPDYLDPLGRSVRISFRKLFF